MVVTRKQAGDSENAVLGRNSRTGRVKTWSTKRLRGRIWKVIRRGQQANARKIRILSIGIGTLDKYATLDAETWRHDNRNAVDTLNARRNWNKADGPPEFRRPVHAAYHIGSGSDTRQLKRS